MFQRVTGPPLTIKNMNNKAYIQSRIQKLEEVIKSHEAKGNRTGVAITTYSGLSARDLVSNCQRSIKMMKDNLKKLKSELKSLGG